MIKENARARLQYRKGRVLVLRVETRLKRVRGGNRTSPLATTYFANASLFTTYGIFVMSPP